MAPVLLMAMIAVTVNVKHPSETLGTEGYWEISKLSPHVDIRNGARNRVARETIATLATYGLERGEIPGNLWRP